MFKGNLFTNLRVTELIVVTLAYNTKCVLQGNTTIRLYKDLKVSKA